MRRLALPLLCALLLAAPFCFALVGDSDAGWHLALGRLIAQSGLPHTNALTWTARDVPWYDTSWLWDWLSYLLVARFGLTGLQALTLVVFAVTLAAAGIACAHADREIGAWLVAALALLLVPRLTVRPHVATWAGVAAVVALCTVGSGRHWRWRAACVPLIALAGNLHSGAPFAAGVLGLFCAQELWRSRKAAEALIAAAGIFALLANPGGLFNLRSLLWHLLHVRHVVVIQEYDPPTLQTEPLFFVLLPLALWLSWRRRREQPAVLAAVVIFGALGLKAGRMVYEFEIIAAPLFAAAVGSLRSRSRRLPALSAALAAIACGASHQILQRYGELQAGAAWDPATLPVRAVEFARPMIRGRLFNAYSHGGYLEWALPEVPALVDGRVQCFPPEFFKRFYAASHSPAGFQAWLRELDAEWAMVYRRLPWLSGRDLLAPPDWALVYWDDVSEVWLRRDVPRYAPLIAGLEYRRFRPHAQVLQLLAAGGRAEATEWLAEIDRYSQTTDGDPAALVARCAALSRLGSPLAPEACARAELLIPPALRPALQAARAVKPGPEKK